MGAPKKDFDTSQPALWFRFWAEFLTDPKVQMLSEADQRRYTMVLCLRCSNGNVTLQDSEIVFQLRISDEEWVATKARLRAKDLIDERNLPTAWDKRQFASDSSKERVKKHRDKLKQAGNVTVTAPETETETETETEKRERDADALPPIALAQKVAAELCLTGHGLIEAIAGAIEFCIKYENRSADQAVEFLIHAGRVTLANGGTPNKFWFTDRKWRVQQTTPQPAASFMDIDDDPEWQEIKAQRKRVEEERLAAGLHPLTAEPLTPEERAQYARKVQ